MVEFCAERACVWLTRTLSMSLHKYTRAARGQDGSGSKDIDISGAGEEGYAALCAGWEAIERNGTRHLRSPCYTV